jgi:hypothetical protein
MNPSGLPEPFIRPGDAITAEGLNKLARVASKSTLLPGQFQNTRLNLQAIPPSGGGSAGPVYKLQKCLSGNACVDDIRYISNTEAGSHIGGDEPIAIISDNGIISCWEVIERVTTTCKSAECVVILGWGEDCTACTDMCFKLTACPTLPEEATPPDEWVTGADWLCYIGKVVEIGDEASTECYTVGFPQKCSHNNVNEDLSVDDIVRVYVNCQGCLACFIVHQCGEGGGEENDVAVTNDLFTHLGIDDFEAIEGVVFKDSHGICWEVIQVSYPCVVPLAQLQTLDLPDPAEIQEDCDKCCLLFEPCEGNEGEAFVARPSSAELDEIDPAEIIGKVVREDVGDPGMGDCWMVSEAPCTEEAEAGLLQVEEVYDDCICCVITRWKKCFSDPPEYIRTFTNLCPYLPTDEGVFTGSLLRAEDDLCYEWATEQEGEEDPVPFTVQYEFDDCDTCVIRRYKLNPNCPDPCSNWECKSDLGGGEVHPPIVTETDLFPYLGKYLKYDGICYLVEKTTDELTEDELDYSCLTGPFLTCDECKDAATTIRFVTEVEIVSGVLRKRYKYYSLPANFCSGFHETIADIEDCPEVET